MNQVEKSWVGRAANKITRFPPPLLLSSSPTFPSVLTQVEQPKPSGLRSGRHAKSLAASFLAKVPDASEQLRPEPWVGERRRREEEEKKGVISFRTENGREEHKSYVNERKHAKGNTDAEALNTAKNSSTKPSFCRGSEADVDLIQVSRWKGPPPPPPPPLLQLTVAPPASAASQTRSAP